MLEGTKQRQRLQQEARTIAKPKPEQLEIEIEISEKLSGELECSNTDTARQYTLSKSDDEEDCYSTQLTSKIKNVV